MNFAPGKIPLGSKNSRKCIHSVSAQETAKRRAVWLTSVERHRCSKEVKTRNPLKFAGVPETRQPMSAVSRLKFTVLRGHVEKIFYLTRFFPIVEMCLGCEDVARQSCAMVRRWRFFCVLGLYFSAIRVQHIFRPAF